MRILIIPLIVALSVATVTPTDAAGSGFSSVRPDRPSAETDDPAVCVGHENWENFGLYSDPVGQKLYSDLVKDITDRWENGETVEAQERAKAFAEFLVASDKPFLLRGNQFAWMYHDVGADDLIVPHYAAIYGGHDFDAEIRTMWDLSRVIALIQLTEWSLRFNFDTGREVLLKLFHQIDRSKICDLYKYEGFEFIVAPLTRWVDREQGLRLFAKMETMIATIQRTDRSERRDDYAYRRGLSERAAVAQQWALAERLLIRTFVDIHQFVGERKLTAGDADKLFSQLGSLSYSIHEGPSNQSKFESKFKNGDYRGVWPPPIPPLAK